MKALVLCTRLRLCGHTHAAAAKISIREFNGEIRYILGIGSQACYFSATTLRYGQSAADNNVLKTERNGQLLERNGTERTIRSVPFIRFVNFF